MLKKLGAWLIGSMLMLGLVTGCGKTEEQTVPPAEQEMDNEAVTPSVEAHPEATPEEVEEEAVFITERVEKNGQLQSYLTGEWIDKEIADRRPLAVMIPNNTPAMPQYGLSKAAIIYEAPVEGRITRLMAVFEDFDDLDRIGPVRSSRDYFLYVAMGYEAIYCNWGLARPYVEELINREDVQNISAAVEGIYQPAHEAYDRVKRSGYATEFTGYLFIDGMKEAADRLGYTWEHSDAFVPPFAFARDDTDVASYYEAYDSVTKIYPGGQSGNKGGYGAYNPWFEYHEEDGLYYRFQEGKEQIDEYADGEQLAVANVVLQYCHGEVRDDHDYLAFGVHGEGNAIVFTGGKMIPGTWERYDGDGTPARFFDREGNEIVLNQGKTWICNIWEEYGEFVSYE